MDISYLHGRAVVGILTGDESLSFDGAVWSIELEGNGFIHCFDDSHEPPVLDGLAFTTSSVSDTEARLYFGTDANPTGTMIVFRLDDFGCSDDVYSDGAVVRPNVAQEDAGATETPAEPDPRVAEGPSEEWLAAERKRIEEANDDGA